MTTRLFLVAPPSLAEATLLACVEAACANADCASILVPATVSQGTVEALQAFNLAVMLRDADVATVHALKADGLMLSSLEGFKDARLNLKDESLGIIAGASRHEAMEAAEAGADVVAFTQTKQYAGIPIIGWWQETTDVPAIAFDPVDGAALAMLKPQNPDFITPSDEMWTSPEAAARVVKSLMAQWMA